LYRAAHGVGSIVPALAQNARTGHPQFRNGKGKLKGRATRQGDTSQKLNAEIHRKYLSAAAIADPRVGPVFAGWDDVTLKITPVTVISWDMREADAQVFGGSFRNNPTYLLPLEK
jgi:hypothetical protein